MQHCSCIVYLSGDRGSSVHKPDVTVAEIALLRAIHGDDGVAGIKPTFIGKEKPADELYRLRSIYTPLNNMTREGGSIFDKVYPGRAPNVPKTLSDIGGGDDVDPADSWDDEEPGAAVDGPQDDEPPAPRNLGGRPRKDAAKLME